MEDAYGKSIREGQKVMARPRKIDTDALLRIVDDYFESKGDPSKLKCSYLEEYAISLGVDVKAYDFRRNVAVRQRMEELRDLSLLRSDGGAIAYKTLDVDAFLARCHTKIMLRNSLLELDETWRRIYERAAEMSKQNEMLKAAEDQAIAKQGKLLSEVTELSEQLKRINRESRDTVLENRYLRKMLKVYLFPAIANEILLWEKVLEQVDTEVTQIAMDQLVDPAIPSPFHSAIAADRTMLSREEMLLSRMWEKTLGGQDDA
jgi:hypothetical protein